MSGDMTEKIKLSIAETLRTVMQESGIIKRVNNIQFYFGAVFTVQLIGMFGFGFFLYLENVKNIKKRQTPSHWIKLSLLLDKQCITH